VSEFIEGIVLGEVVEVVEVVVVLVKKVVCKCVFCKKVVVL